MTTSPFEHVPETRGAECETRPKSREVCRIIVPWDVHRTSPNQRGHWRAKAKLTAQGRDRAALAWHCAGRPTSAVPVRVSMIVRRARTLDEDNAIGGSKCLRDSLFNRAITPHDGRAWVRLGTVEFETGKRYRGAEEVEFIVEEREADHA